MALTYDQIDSITTKTYIPKLVDNVFDTNAALKRFNRPGYKKVKTGGTSIMAPVIADSSTTGGWYQGLDTLDISATSNMTSAEFQWKQFYEAILISRADLLKNSGDAQKLSLIESKMKIAEASIQAKMETGIFSAGTESGGDIITGLQALMSTSTTYGGIAVADMSSWVAVVKDNSSTNRALTLPLMQQAVGAATYGSMKPTVAYMNQEVYDQVWALYQPHQRLMSAEMSKLGFNNVLEFNGIPCLVTSYCPANTIYFVDEENVNLCAHRDEDMRKSKLSDLETSNAMLTKIFWMGNLICHSRRTNASLTDISVAS